VAEVEQGFWMRRVVDGIGATSEVMFPGNDSGAPDWRETEMVARTVDYFDELSPRMRSLLMLLFVFFELGSPLLLAGIRRFSKLSPERRLRTLLRWRRSKFYPFKILIDALKAQLCMMYMSHQSVQDYMRVFKTCDRPTDTLRFEIRRDVFSADTPNGLREAADT